MVNEERIRKKIPELLVDGSLSVRSNLYKYQSQRRKFRRIELKDFFSFNRHTKKCASIIVKALEEYERVMNNLEFEF